MRIIKGLVASDLSRLGVNEGSVGDGRRGEKRIPHAVRDDTRRGGGHVGTKASGEVLGEENMGNGSTGLARE